MSSKSEVLVYIGTYTEKRPDGGGSKGVYVAPFDQSTGGLGALTLAAELENPSFVDSSRDARVLYAVSEVGVPDAKGEPTGAVAAYSIGSGGSLTALNRTASVGADPCHVAVSRTGHTVAVANYTGGSTIALRTRADGGLGVATVDRHTGHGPNAQRQERAHAHSVEFSADDRTLLSCDLGTDRIYLYRHDAKAGTIVPNAPPFVALEPGSGPRHLALHPSGRWAYVLAELSSSVLAFTWNARTRALHQFQSISTLPFGYTSPNTTAEIVVHPSGRFVYASNRGHDSIAAYAVDAHSGRLTFLAHTPTGGKAPRSFAIDPSGRWLLAANQLSDSILTFALDQHTGALATTGSPVSVPRPVCVHFVARARA